jgi:cytochrome c peroxidase
MLLRRFVPVLVLLVVVPLLHSSPRPGTPGRGVGGEGLSRSGAFVSVLHGREPLTPNPSPRSTGARGAHLQTPPAVPRDLLPATLDLETIPLGLGPRPVPKEHPLTAARVALGRKLFFDPLLSADRTIACVSCHVPERGFSHGEPRGVGGKTLRRRAPSLFNRAYGTAFFWDGRAQSLEDQALKPIEDPDEMGSSVAEALRRLKEHTEYPKLFAAAFDDGLTAPNLARALAAFERALVRGDSPVDRFVHKHDHAAMTEPERHGMWIFDSKGSCWRCHTAPHYSDEKFHNTGVSWGKTPLDLGRFETTKQEADKGRFKTPTLRGVKMSAPYMHDGSLKTLEDVVDFYDRGGVENPHRDSVLQPLNLSADEKRNLVAFLKSL